jgi:type VI secretion system protein ImpJ
MYLGPHHFQAQSRYFEDVIHFAAESLCYCPWGFLGLELSQEALRNGTLLVSYARGIFPDGLAFDMPSADAAPDPRQVAGMFPPTADSLMISFGIPSRRNGGNCALEPDSTNGDMRYLAEEKLRVDDIKGLDEKPVRFGKKNIRFIGEGENTAGLEILPVARVLRNGVGEFVYDETFVPPSIRISASPYLMSLSRRMIDILEEKARAFTGRVMNFGKQATGVSPQQVAAFWFLHGVNTSISTLRHQYLTAQDHPERLFSEFLKLAGALCTFGVDSSAANLASYDHLALDRCFRSLDEHIRRHLEIFVPTNCVSIKLKKREHYIWEGAVSDTRYFTNARWFFAVSAAVGEAELILQTPQKVKICSARFVPELVRRALPGMTLSHVPVPPSSLSPSIQSQYFSLNQSGPCWDHIVETRSVGVYIPGEIANPKVEILILLES